MMNVLPTATIEGLYIATAAGDFLTTPVGANGDGLVEMRMTPEDGIIGDQRHGGAMAEAGTRLTWYPDPKALARNMRQVSAVDAASLERIGEQLGLDEDAVAEHTDMGFYDFMARSMGANALVTFHPTEEHPDFNLIPNGTDFGTYDTAKGPQKMSGAIVRMTYNAPCPHPGKKMRELLAGSGMDSARMGVEFNKASKNLRGLVGGVMLEGAWRAGDQASFGFLPTAESTN